MVAGIMVELSKDKIYVLGEEEDLLEGAIVVELW